MATSSKTGATGSLSSDAAFRTYHKDISDTIKNAGASLTSDTGQIDFSTVARPAAGYTSAGYEIFKLDTDTQFSSLGLYIKLEYCTGSSTARPGFAITVGTGTNGSGTLTGTVSTRYTFFPSATPNSATVRATTGDGRFCVVPHEWLAGRTDSGGNWAFVVERLRDTSGNLTSDGIHLFFIGSSSTYVGYSETLIPNAVLSTSSSKAGTLLNNATGVVGSDTNLSALFPVVRHKAYAAVTSVLFYYKTDFTTGTTFSVSRYGTNRTYLPLGQIRDVDTSWAYDQFGHRNAGLAIQWE